MRTRTKKMLSLLLAAAMVFTMNSFAFAAETIESEAVIAEEGTLVDGTDAASDASPNYVVSGDKLLSENAASISENLHEVVAEQVGTSDYFIVYPRAIAFDGKNKPGSKKAETIDVKVYKRKTTTLSGADLISDNKVVTTSFNEVSVKKVKIKAAKGATVGLDGKAIAGVKKSTYIKDIKLSDKTENKAFKAVFKDIAKGLKKNTNKVSANGVQEGGTSEVAFVIGVYPCYGGNSKSGLEVAKNVGLKLVTSVDKVKEKNGAVKSIKVTTAGKKVTLKVTKKADKPKGLKDGKKNAATAEQKADGGKANYVELDGNFAGNYYLD